MRSQTLHNPTGNELNKSPVASKLQEVQRFAELGRLTASLLHEISNPLTAALLQLEQYKDQSSAGAKRALRSIKTMRNYVDAARQQIRQNSPQMIFRVNPQVKQVQQIVVPLARQAGVDLQFGQIPECKLYGDAVKFQQILANLTVNAIEAYASDAAPDLDKPVRVTFEKEPGWITFKVVDWGQGISADQIPLIFDAFYTTKSQAGHGLGIGLSIVKQFVIEEFNGEIQVSSSARMGTIFNIKIKAS